MRIAFQYGSRIFDDRYPTSSDALDAFRAMIKAYMREWMYDFNTQYLTTQLEYNPIWNYDGTDKETITRTPNLQYVTNGSSTIGASGGTDNTEHQVAPYDSRTYEPQDKSNRTYSNQAQNNSSNSTTKETGTDKTERELIRGGNQGTTTTQSMIVEERSVAQYDFWDYVFRKIIDTLTINIWE